MSTATKPVVLIFTKFYLPGYRGGGPIRSISNMVERLSGDYSFYIIASDRDLHDEKAYDSVTVDSWNEVGGAKVFYASPSNSTLLGFSRLLSQIDFDILYLNSFFDPKYSILALVAHTLIYGSKKPIVLAPRGEFSEGALSIKKWKKKIFIALAKRIPFYKKLIWHASTEFELRDITRVFWADSMNPNLTGDVIVAPDLVGVRSLHVLNEECIAKRASNVLDVCFLSRISPMKNLDYAINVFSKIDFPISFTIYGPKEDSEYWDLCQGLIANLPAHIEVNYAGEVKNEQVVNVLAQHHLFFLPTRGENFGHVFLEAWKAGLPVLVSDQTPWLDLERRNLGWDIPLNRPDRFLQALTKASKFSEEQWKYMRLSCREYADAQASDLVSLDKNKVLFSKACSRFSMTN